MMADLDTRQTSRPRVQKRDGRWFVAWLLPVPGDDERWLRWTVGVESLGAGIDAGRRGCPVAVGDVTPVPQPLLQPLLGELFVSFGGAA